MPSAMVAAKPQINWARFFLSKPQCAMVMVMPEVSSSAVLIAGMPHAPIGVKSPALKCGPAVGQAESLKAGHSSC